ncbi:hypothetical protein CkaCkLH20_11041 [Colletotrichum karsti]|uniref:Uncharacterized protein n=1 Tax=Colletotrichum karsti TaxID=1095194 RepID=A0A9P6LDC7_9PEZI|nr:uncharacterized protein CkaCkLH20_11041 [Colletotrichum karsti]KAF9871394.1 hypothetical protein CkaCkLH20_11041 [Colletotrichum karsti]
MSQTPSMGSNHSAEIASGSKLPRPKSTIGVFGKGKIPSVADAWQLAGESSPVDRARRTSPAVDASPSPAPRLHANRHALDDAKGRHALGKDAVDYSRARPLSRISNDSLRDNYMARNGGSPASQQSSSSGSFTHRLKEYEREMDRSPSAGRDPESLFSKSRIGPNIAETGRTLARRTSNSSLNGSQGLGRRTSNSSLNGSSQSLGRKTSYGSLSTSPGQRMFAKSSVPEGWIKHLLDQDEKGIKRRSMSRSDWETAAETPLPSIEAMEPTPPTSRPTSAKPEARSPEKSFAWDMDADFTAGDLQISDSPRIRTRGTAFDEVPNQRHSGGGAFAEDPESSPFRREASVAPNTPRTIRSNTKIDEIRRREDLANEQLAERRRSQSTARNTRLEEIREREAEAEEELAKTRAQSRSYYPTPDDLPILDEDDVAPPVREQPRPKNTKLDQIRAREADSLSKKAMAESRLEEIREQNSMSRDLSPDVERGNDKESTPARENVREPWQPAHGDEGERIAYTPVTIYKKAPSPQLNGSQKDFTKRESPARPHLQHTRTDSRDLLQRLARATSSSPASSPAPETQNRPAEVNEKVEEKMEKDTQKQPAQPVERTKTVEEIPKPAEETFKPVEERPKPRIEDRRRPSIEERFRQHKEERLAMREAEASEKTSEKSDAEKPSAEKTAVTRPASTVLNAKEPEKQTEEEASKPYTLRRRSEDQPRSSALDEKVNNTRRNRIDALKALDPAPKSEDPKPSPTDEAKTASESDRPKSAGLRRERQNRSGEAAKDGRKSVAMSDSDPTERIEGEINLFAPTDGQSERGTSRATSVEPESDEDKSLFADETPRPLKVDPLSLPTPKVTGAYVDTPATVRVDKLQEKSIKPAIKSEEKSKNASDSQPPSRRSSRASSRPRSISKASESGSENSDDKARSKPTAGTTTSSSLRRRRSIPRLQRPLTNSVKPPTVKDDLLELQRVHQIEDSTLDDLEDFFKMQELQLPAPEIESIIDEMNVKREKIATTPDLSHAERDHTLQQIDRMNKALQDGLLNIRSAKQGIERLEDKVSHSEAKYGDMNSSEELEVEVLRQQTKKSRRPSETSHQTSERTTQASAEKVNVIQLPIPRLIQRNPFRVTFLGVLVMLASIWYAAESAMCELYCRPTTCSTTPCVWSPTDPTWGVALPVKLDEWATNGRGRRVAHQLSEDVSDLWADAQDYLSGTDIRTIDIRSLDFYGKRQLRRRLRKKGLAKRPAESAEDRVKWDAWHKARVASERVHDAREMGYDISEEDESMGGDEAL